MGSLTPPSWLMAVWGPLHRAGAGRVRGGAGVGRDGAGLGAGAGWGGAGRVALRMGGKGQVRGHNLTPIPSDP